MPKEVRHQLTHQRVTKEKRPGYHCDGGGLYLAVSEHGSRCWIFRATIHGKRREIGMGSAYTLGLADARKLAAEWRVIARSGGDPRAVRDAGKRETIRFEDAARRVHGEQIEPHNRKVIRKLRDTEGRPLNVISGVGRMVTMEGLPVGTTTQLDDGGDDELALLVGDFSDALVGLWGTLEILVNPYAEAQYSRGAVAVRAILSADVAVRRAKSFTKLTVKAAG